MKSLLSTALALAVSLAAPRLTLSQQIGTLTPEVHPRLPTQFCTTAAGCITKQTRLVADSSTHWLHAINDSAVSCNTVPLNATLCPDAATCAHNCAFEGVDYTSQGVLTRGNALTLRQYLYNGTGYAKVSPRLYLLAEDERNYEPVRLLNQELSFEVDMAGMPCGMNGALYLSEMDMSGMRGALNPAGASYGTAYCDAQCFNTSAFVNGQANLNGSGICCNEMDIWEANSAATAFTPHTCSRAGAFLCTGAECGRTAAGVCDKSGCGLNEYALGNRIFYGVGRTVDTSRPFTVVTQFWTSNNASTGTLSEIRRLYVQDGRVIANAGSTTIGSTGAVTQNFCNTLNAADFVRLGGMKAMGESLARGMVLIFSIWNDEGDFMRWLDGAAQGKGPCNATEGDPRNIVVNQPDTAVTFANVRWGDIGTTFNGTVMTMPAGGNGSGNGMGPGSGTGSGNGTGNGNATKTSAGPPRVTTSGAGGGLGWSVAGWGLATLVFLFFIGV